jgi:hypothetical protein
VHANADPLDRYAAIKIHTFPYGLHHLDVLNLNNKRNYDLFLKNETRADY